MLGRLFRRKRREPERYDPWETLLEASASAANEADQLIGDVVRRVAPELGVSVDEVVLDARHWERAFETVISEIENYLEELCGRYDYRQLLFFSRLCAGLPWFRSTEKPEEARMRARSADRWVLRCGNRSLEHDYMRIDERGYSLGHPPNSISYDAVLIHVLAKLHARMIKEHMVFNFMRLASSRNRWPGPRIRFTADGRIGWKFGSAHLQAAANVFVFRYDSYSSTLAQWGMGEFHTQDQPLALAYDLSEEFSDEPYGGGTLFIPRPLWLDAVLEYGSTFSALFERDVGMPVEHLWAICRGLGRLSIQTAAADEAKLADWGGYSATLPVAREELVGGVLEEEARRELDESFAGFQTNQSLSESVTRFVELASSASGGAVSRGGRQRAAEEARTLVYPFMIHGENNHEVWIIDYFMTRSFFQGLVSDLEFSKSKSTTGLRVSDVTTRTSIFDAHLAEMLCEVPGVEEAFREHREQSDLPNVKFRFDGGAQDREIDVALRVGEVLLAVQTWAPGVDFRIEAGEYTAMKRRWEKAKDKLRQTDRRYTDYLLEHPEGKRCMEQEGLRYVLPVVCGPYAEPAVSFEPSFWLHYPSYDADGQIQAPAVPRVLTPIELVYFLANTTEQGLKKVCETNGWALLP